MSDELKPCPFCGGEADNRHGTTVECRNTCPVSVYANDKFPSRSIYKWNTRAPDPDAARYLELLEDLATNFEDLAVMGAAMRTQEVGDWSHRIRETLRKATP